MAMRILHLTPSLCDATSGLAGAVRGMCGALAKADVEVTVAAIHNPDRDKPPPLADYPCILATPSRLPILRQWLYSRELHRQLEATFAAKPPDLIHLHGLWLYPQWLGRQLALRWNIPYVLTLHGMLEPWRFRHHAWKKAPAWCLADRQVVRDAALLHATAPAEAENLRARGLRNSIAVIPLGIAFPESAIQSRGTVPGGTCRPGAFAERGRSAHFSGGAVPSGKGFSWSGGAPATFTALFLSRLHPSKGLPLLVAAVAKTRPTGWRFVIAGPDEGGHQAAIMRLARQAGVADRFEFVGPVVGEAKWRLYAAADLFILPSFNENFGLVVGEALACGVPVLTTMATPWTELAEKGCGWVCEPTTDALATALQQACNTSVAERQAMGESGRAWVRTTFSWAACASALKAIYEGVAADVLPKGPLQNNFGIGHGARPSISRNEECACRDM
ncbi:MAG: glycosyltransferase [Lentisphaeria bacterium]|jgi:glycosyltransferase involved in cell wall biosynthesis